MNLDTGMVVQSVEPQPHGPNPSATALAMHGARALSGGSGDDPLWPRAAASSHQVPGGVRAAYLHGEHHPRDRALGHEKVFHGSQAFVEHGEHPRDSRASAAHGDLLGQDRAVHLDELKRGLFQCGPERSSNLAVHDVGGGGVGAGKYGRNTYGPWTEGSGSMNTRHELPDLPPDSSPVQFGDWLHLITPK